jgi:hypothetical protein
MILYKIILRRKFNMSRPKIKKIIVEFEGDKPKIELDGEHLPEALCFSDRTVKWMGTIWEIYKSGKQERAQNASGNLTATKATTSEEVEKMWNTEIEVKVPLPTSPSNTEVSRTAKPRELPSLMAKMPSCIWEAW